MADNDRFDLIIIGAGPGGYPAAARAAQLGMSAACVEKSPRLGGVCLNVGCIPSKALLDSSEYYHLARDHFADHGIRVQGLDLDMATMMARKDQVVEDLTDQVRRLLEGRGVSIFHGAARLAGEGRVVVTMNQDGSEKTLTADRILLATGSRPIDVPGVEVDHEAIVDSTDALRFDRPPESLGIMGGGYIGVELGSVWMRLGSKVTVLEMADKAVGLLDGQIQRALERLLKRQGMEFRLKTKVVSAKRNGDRVETTVESGGRREALTFDRLLVAVGRKPLTEGLGLEDLGVKTNDAGFIVVDENYQTSVPGVFAVGDLTPGPMLAHKAAAEGVAAVEAMNDLPGEVNYDAVPAVVYTWPEAAMVGLTEERAKEMQIPYCVGTYPFSGAGRARCMGEKDGLVKLIAHQKTDRVLGVHILGPRASDIIAEAVLAIEMGAAAEDLARTVHGHPTFSEALMEAAKGIGECSIYTS
jgi:dihydrolipoamide dehydrogenase